MSEMQETTQDASKLSIGPQESLDNMALRDENERFREALLYYARLFSPHSLSEARRLMGSDLGKPAREALGINSISPKSDYWGPG